MRGGRVAVVGGSIAGCAFASAAARSGADEVVVFERTPGRLADRGVGLCVHDDRYEELAAAGYLDEGIAWHRLTRRHWLVQDGSDRGRLMWDQPFPFRSYHWGLLWRGLRELTPATVSYRLGHAVAGVGPADSPAGGLVGGVADGSADSRARVRLESGVEEDFDLVVGADGYRSVVREAVCPGARPQYAGYVCWRGSFPAERLAVLRPGAGPVESHYPSAHVATVCFPGGSCVIYRIPGVEPGSAMVNWVLYAEPPATGLRLDDPTSIPPGALADELLSYLGLLTERHFPPYWADVIALTSPEHTFVQPIYDLGTPNRTAGRLLLAGDAATVVRPHNTSGAAKALQDAFAFESAWREAGSWRELLAAYERDRGQVGQALVTLGRNLGRAQVEQTPDWASMDSRQLESWWEQQVGGAAGFGGHALVAEPKPR
nr:FAD-dependent monooxygenase [Kitasatospora sp. MAP5-34]